MKNPDVPRPLEVRLFSVLREVVGSRSVHMALDRPETVAAILDRLVAHNPDIEPYRDSIRVAVNLEYVDDEYTVFNGDEMALITPVSGG